MIERFFSLKLDSPVAKFLENDDFKAMKIFTMPADYVAMLDPKLVKNKVVALVKVNQKYLFLKKDDVILPIAKHKGIYGAFLEKNGGYNVRLDQYESAEDTFEAALIDHYEWFFARTLARKHPKFTYIDLKSDGQLIVVICKTDPEDDMIIRNFNQNPDACFLSEQEIATSNLAEPYKQAILNAIAKFPV